MISLFLILLPLAGLLVVWASGNRLKVHVGVINVTALLHCAATASLWFFPELDDIAPGKISELIGQDFLSLTVLSVVSFLNLLSSVQTIKYFPMVRQRFVENAEKFLSPQLVAICLLGFLSSMTLVASSRNFGLLWVAVEATTLASAPLIAYHRSPSAIEAMWKYLVICSVGIGLALFGTFMLGVSMRFSGSHAEGLGFLMIADLKNTLDPQWFKAAFLFCLAGYGLKMGLAPFHIASIADGER